MSKNQPPRCLIDIGANLRHKLFHPKSIKPKIIETSWRRVVQRAVMMMDNNNAGDGGVVHHIHCMTSNLKTARESLDMAQQWHTESGLNTLFGSAGIHPHYAAARDASKTELLRELLNDPYCVAVGTCGLDYEVLKYPDQVKSTPKEQQIRIFTEQIALAVEFQLPLFVYERDAADDLVAILDDFGTTTTTNRLPPVIINNFTSNRQDAVKYMERGYYLGLSGFVSKKIRGFHLRDFLHELPLERIMLQSNAPYMGSRHQGAGSEPANIVDTAQTVSHIMGIEYDDVCRTTTETALRVFGLENWNPKRGVI